MTRLYSRVSASMLAYKAWFISLAGLVGSLYFSEVQHLPPCVLCWYQRICMYPLAVILAVGIIKKDKNVAWYALPLTVIGSGIAIFHVLLQAGIIPEAAAPCQAGISCTTKYAEIFGIFTIPQLSMIAFLFLTALMVLIIKKKSWAASK